MDTGCHPDGRFYKNTRYFGFYGAVGIQNRTGPSQPHLGGNPCGYYPAAFTRSAQREPNFVNWPERAGEMPGIGSEPVAAAAGVAAGARGRAERTATFRPRPRAGLTWRSDFGARECLRGLAIGADFFFILQGRPPLPAAVR